MGREFEPGSRFGPLHFERELGRGAFAAVWLARDTVLDRPVAVKVLRTAPVANRPEGTEGPQDRFLNEARLVGRLKSPHVVTLYGVHALPADEGWLLEMEYLEEGTLQDVLDRGVRLPPERVRGIVRAIASALAAAHAHGVVHGDVKPANVLLGRSGEVKLSDFGLAFLVEGASHVWGAHGEIAGTPSYMAPEVVQGERATVASDVWSVGVILYRLLAGRLPFDGRSADALFAQIHNASPPPMADDAAPDLARLALRCLAKQPSARPPAAEALLVAVDEPEGAAAHPPPEPAASPAPPPALVGREADAAQISALLDAARGGAGGVAVVTGDAGMGKTALLRHAADLARSRGFHVIEISVTPVRGLVRPLLLALRDTVGDPSGDFGARPRGRPLVTFESLGRQASVVRRAFGETEDPRPPDRHETAWAAEQILAAVVRRRPVTVLLDDAHHADREDAALLADVAAHLRESPFVLVVAARPRGDDGTADDGSEPSALKALAALAGAVRIDLGPLASDVLYGILRDAARGRRIVPEVANRILDVAEGNPLLATELLRHLLQSGAVVEHDGRLEGGADFRGADLPRRFHELVALRIERFPPDDRAILDVAAVDGLAFDGDAIANVLESPLLVVLRRLQGLARRGGLIVPQAAGYRFSYAVVQEAIYRDLAPDLRRATHRRLAEHLETRGSSVEPERLGTHWERAGEEARAAPYLLRAASDATQRQDYHRALDLATRGRLLPDGISPSSATLHADLLFALCGCLTDLGQPGRAEEIVLRVLEAADTAGDSTLRERAVVWREDIRFHSEGAEAVEVAALERACAALPQSDELGRAHYLLGSVAKVKDRLDEAARRLHAAQEVFAAIGGKRFLATTKNQLASVALRAGRLAEAESAYAEAAAASTSAGRRTNAAVSSVNGILAAFARGRVEGLEAPMRRAIRTLECAGAANHAALATVVLSQILYAGGDVAGASLAVSDALESVERAKFLPGIANSRLERARLAGVRGDLDAARADLVAAREAARAAGDREVTLDALALDVRCAAFAADRRTGIAAATALLASARAGAGNAAVAKLVLSLAESVIHGLPAEVLDDAADLVAAVVPGEDPTAALAPVVAAAAREVRGGGVATAAIHRAVAEIREHCCGDRRAELRALATWLEAFAALRAGDSAAGAERAEAAHREATALGHVWIEASALALLVKAVPRGDAADRLTQVLERVERGLQWEDDRRRLRQAWGRG